MMIFAHMIALFFAVLIDRLIGDPRSIPHPVVGFGKIIAAFDRRYNQGDHRKGKGVFMLISLLLLVFILSVAVVSVAYYIHLYVGIFAEAYLISTTIAAKGLKDAAEEVRNPLSQLHYEEARLKLSYIVGRDTDNLQEEEITRATVETVAENTTDGVTAPLFYALIGGAPLALVYRAINTCDSMVGYKNETYEQFGWASARFDDVVNYIPVRLTAFITLLMTKPDHSMSKKECWKILKREAPKHLSPNSGWGEAATAIMLGVQLGGTSTYKGIVSERPTIGINRRQLEADDIRKANKIMLRTVNGFTMFLLVIGGVMIALT